MSNITADERQRFPAIDHVMSAVRRPVLWLTSPNPTIVWKAELTGDILDPAEEPYAYGRISATGLTREAALAHLEVLVQRVVTAAASAPDAHQHMNITHCSR